MAERCNCAHYGHAYRCPVHTQDDFAAADRAIGRGRVMAEHTAEIDARVQAVAQVINRRTGSHMGSESWLPCAREVVDTLDSLARAMDGLTRVIPPGSDAE